MLGSEKHVLVVVVPNANEGVLEVGEEAAEVEGEWDARLFFFFGLGTLLSSNKASIMTSQV